MSGIKKSGLLREEYEKFIEHKKKLLDKAAYGWVENNVILVNEQINRITVKRIINAITKFDETFGPYKTKIPMIAAQLNAAEDDLQKVITGKVNEKKASDTLKRLSFLYNAFSRFFTSDLPVLLSSHLFLAPKNSPDVRLDSLQPGEGTEKYNPKAIKDAFTFALVPSKEEQRFVSAIYRSRTIPFIDAPGIATQLLGLSYNELVRLKEIGKVPMVVATEEVEPAEPAPPAEATPSSTPAEPTVQPPANAGSATADAVESVDGDIAKILKEWDEPTEEEKEREFLGEAGGEFVLDDKKLTNLGSQFNKVTQVFAPYAKRMPQTKQVIDAINKKINDVMTQRGSAAKDKLLSIFGRNVEADILNVYGELKAFLKAWPTIKGRMGDYPVDRALDTDKAETQPPSIDDRDKYEETSKAVISMVKRSVTRRLLNFRKQILSPDVFASEITALSANEIDQVDSGLKLPEVSQIDPSGRSQQQQAAKSAFGGAKPARPTQGTEQAGVEPTGQTTGKPLPGTEPLKQQSSEELEQIALKFMDKNKIPKARLGDVHTQLIALSKSGFNIVPRQE
jgi:hypothetical protein